MDLIKFLYLLEVVSALRLIEVNNFSEEITETAAFEEIVYCVDSENTLDILDGFTDISFVVRALEGSEFELFDVKGLSSDDFYRNLRNLVHLALLSDEERNNVSDSKIGTSEEEFEGIARDLLSACPSLISSSKTKCKLSFSPYGRSCVMIRAKEKITFSVSVLKNFNIQRLLSMLGGVLVIYFANILNKNIVFHYSAGTLLFTIGGILVILLFLLRTVLRGKSGSSVGYSFLAGSYFTWLWWLSKRNLKIFLLHYWEYVLGYFSAMTLLGLISTRLARGNDYWRRVVSSGVKWILRLFGFMLIYHSLASPLLSMSATIVLLMFYVLYTLVKLATKKSTKLH